MKRIEDTKKQIATLEKDLLKLHGEFDRYEDTNNFINARRTWLKIQEFNKKLESHRKLLKKLEGAK